MMTDRKARRISELVQLNLDSIDPSIKPAPRGQHRKHHGLVRGVLRVYPDIPEHLRVGLFAQANEFRAFVRFSNGRARDDRKADAHGMAIKLLDVPGPKLLSGREDETAQDFILVDSETFFTGAPLEYALVNRATMATRWWRRLWAWLGLIIRPRLLLRMSAFIGAKPHSPLSSSYFSAVPYRLGPNQVKYVAEPLAPFDPGPVNGPDGLSRELVRALRSGRVSFRFGVDLRTDEHAQPIDDPTIAWSRVSTAKRIWLADLELPVQDVDPASALAENLSFSPWHCLTAHEPIGYINEARRPIYRAMQKARHEANAILPDESSEAPASYELSAQ